MTTDTFTKHRQHNTAGQHLGSILLLPLKDECDVEPQLPTKRLLHLLHSIHKAQDGPLQHTHVLALLSGKHYCTNTVNRNMPCCQRSLAHTGSR